MVKLTLLQCVFPPTGHTHSLLLLSQFLENVTVSYNLELTEDTLSLFLRGAGTGGDTQAKFYAGSLALIVLSIHSLICSFIQR